MAVRRIKSVTVRTTTGVHTYHDPSRVFTNSNGSVTVMNGSNTPAVGRHSNVVGTPRYRFYPAV